MVVNECYREEEPGVVETSPPKRTKILCPAGLGDTSETVGTPKLEEQSVEHRGEPASRCQPARTPKISINKSYMRKGAVNDAATKSLIISKHPAPPLDPSSNGVPGTQKGGGRFFSRSSSKQVFFEGTRSPEA